MSDGADIKPQCVEHKEPFIAFCSNEGCKSAICVSCMEKHIGHQLLNHKSFADYIRQNVDSTVTPIIVASKQECEARTAEVSGLPEKVKAEIQAVQELVQNMAKIALGQEEKFKATVEAIKTHCDKEAGIAKVTHEKLDSQTDTYKKALDELDKQKTAKSFEGVLGVWTRLQSAGQIERLKVDKEQEAVVAADAKKVSQLCGLITALASATIKKLNQLPALADIVLAEPKSATKQRTAQQQSPAKASPAPDPILTPPKAFPEESEVEAKSGSKSHSSCVNCGANKHERARLACGHLLCAECCHDLVAQKFVETFPDVFSPELPCRECGTLRDLSQIVLQNCGCLCDTKALRVKQPFQWSPQRNAFEWPACSANPEHKLDMEDILTIWGSGCCGHFEKELTVDQAISAYGIKRELGYMIVGRPHSSEQVLGLMQAFRASETVRHIVCAAKTVQGPEKLRLMFEALSLNPRHLQTLIIKQNPVGMKEALAKLSEVVPMLGNLTVLDLSGNDLGAEGVRFVAEGIVSCEKCRLRTLSLANNEIGLQGAKYLSECMDRLPSLQQLYIDHNKVGMKGAKYIAGSLDKVPGLRLLSMSGNSIGGQGAKYLCEGVERTNSIEVLRVNANDMATEGGKCLAEAICKCPSLRILELQQNRLGTEAVKKLAEAIGTCETLRGLSVADNFISLEGAKMLVEAAAQSPGLKLLDISAHKFPAGEVEGFKAVLATKGIVLKI